MIDRKPLHVVAAALEDSAGRILVTQRPAGKRQAGRWEFPGGKVEPGEAVMDALARELREELSVELGQSEPLIQLHHDYADFSVFLDVHSVKSWTGDIAAMESQAMQWCFPGELHDVDILEADLPIIHALQLPPAICITPNIEDRTGWWDELDATLEAASRASTRRFLQLRQPRVSEEEYLELARKVLPLAKSRGVEVILNGAPELIDVLPEAAGLHLPSRFLHEYVRSEVGGRGWLSAAVHNSNDLNSALRLGVDYLLISPVKETGSHPGAAPLGWKKFDDLARAAGIPAYALGGMHPDDLKEARQHGAQGVAGIGNFWVSKT